MPFLYPDDCPKCEQPHGIPVSWETLGEHDCPKCGAKNAIEIEWETEYFLEPITEDDK
jgi:hypothetical protein